MCQRTRPWNLNAKLETQSPETCRRVLYRNHPHPLFLYIQKIKPDLTTQESLNPTTQKKTSLVASHLSSTGFRGCRPEPSRRSFQDRCGTWDWDWDWVGSSTDSQCTRCGVWEAFEFAEVRSFALRGLCKMPHGRSAPPNTKTKATVKNTDSDRKNTGSKLRQLSWNVGSGHCFSMPQAASNRAPFAADAGPRPLRQGFGTIQ